MISAVRCTSSKPKYLDHRRSRFASMYTRSACVPTADQVRFSFSFLHLYPPLTKDCCRLRSSRLTAVFPSRCADHAGQDDSYIRLCPQTSSIRLTIDRFVFISVLISPSQRARLAHTAHRTTDRRRSLFAPLPFNGPRDVLTLSPRRWCPRYVI